MICEIWYEPNPFTVTCSKLPFISITPPGSLKITLGTISGSKVSVFHCGTGSTSNGFTSLNKFLMQVLTCGPLLLHGDSAEIKLIRELLNLFALGTYSKKLLTLL